MFALAYLDILAAVSCLTPSLAQAVLARHSPSLRRMFRDQGGVRDVQLQMPRIRGLPPTLKVMVELEELEDRGSRLPAVGREGGGRPGDSRPPWLQRQDPHCPGRLALQVHLHLHNYCKFH